MRSYVYRPNMDKDIENIVKSSKSCALAAKVTPIKYSPWPKTDRLWSRIHVYFAGPLNWFYYLLVEWPEEIPLQKLQSISSTNCSPDLG